MEFLSKTEFLILTICFGFFRKELHTIYAPGQRIRVIVYVIYCMLELGMYNLPFILLYNVLGPPNSIMPYFARPMV